MLDPNTGQIDFVAEGFYVEKGGGLSEGAGPERSVACSTGEKVFLEAEEFEVGKKHLVNTQSHKNATERNFQKSDQNNVWIVWRRTTEGTGFKCRD